jgi:hypothetical protein
LSSGDSAPLAFVHAITGHALILHEHWEKTRDQSAILTFNWEEDNMLSAFRLAPSYKTLDTIVTGLLKGLHELYQQSGRLSEFDELLDRTMPFFAQGETLAPLPGRDTDDWKQLLFWKANQASARHRSG